MTEEKNSNLLIFGIGIVVVFFGYLIYMKSKDSVPLQLPTQPAQGQIQPIQSTQLDNIQLYKIQLQTQQIADQLQAQNNQMKLIQEQQMSQLKTITDLENAKCSNVVSMNNKPNINTLESLSYKFPSNISTNVRRETEEFISNRMFGMK